ncbi:MAG TPA: serine/threonine-protein kinase [Candidatus Dormibacteraeota bacterium]
MTVGPGTHIGPYEVQDFIGQGAMGMVYKAWHEALARPAAVKVLQALAPDTEAAARFRREAQSIAQMRHPNILHVFDFGELEGVPYMIIEYVPGGSLADRSRAGRLSDADAIRLLRGLAAALDYAHGLGVVHRDVKPANVLIAADGSPILADFGLAKLLQSTSMKSATGVTTGTPAYMAPEQVTATAVGPSADRYALATLAYELITGQLPYEAEGVLEVLYAHVHRDPLPPSARRPDLAPAVDQVLLRGLARDPEQRWASCGEMVEALDAALEEKAPAVAATLPLAPASVGGGRRRLALLAAGAAAVAALLVLSAIAYAIGNRPRQVPTPTPTPSHFRIGNPQPTPAHTPTPTPSKSFHPVIAVSTVTPKPGQALVVDGRDFDPARQYSLVVREGTNTAPLQNPASVPANGIWSAHVTLPGNLQPGTGLVIACIYSPGVSPRAEDCAQQEISVQKA